MPMCINKVKYFEKRNNLKINIFGLDDKNEIIPSHEWQILTPHQINLKICQSAFFSALLSYKWL